MPALAPLAFGYLLVLLRVAAMFQVAPLYGARSIPTRVRIGVVVPVALAIFFGAGAPGFAGWQSIGGLVGAAVTETVIGLSMGLGCRLVLDAAYAGGQLASQAMGLGFGAILDPVDGASSTSVAELVGLLATSALIAAGGHREVVAALARSVVHAPPGTTSVISAMLGNVIASGLQGISLAVRIAYPVLAAVLVGQVALGMLSRTAPQLNISSVGFSVTILVGGGVLYVMAPSVAELAARSAIARLTGS